MAVLVIVILILVLVALYPVVRDLVRRRHASAPAYVEGLQFALDGNPAEALAKLKETVSSDPDNLDAWVRLGDILIRQGETERGIKVHENLGLRRNLAPADERKVLRALARDYLATDRKLKATSTLEELARLDPYDTHAVAELFRLYVETTSWDKCEKLLSEIGRHPHDRAWAARLFAELGRAYSPANPKAAQDCFDKALRLDRDSVDARLYQGDLRMSQHDTQAAIRTWSEILELAPEKNSLVRQRLEAAFYESGRYDEITRVYEQLLRKAPKDEGLAIALAGIYEKREDLAKAVRLLERFAGPEAGPALLIVLASALLRQGDTDRAARLLDDVAARLGQGTLGRG